VNIPQNMSNSALETLGEMRSLLNQKIATVLMGENSGVAQVHVIVTDPSVHVLPASINSPPSSPLLHPDADGLPVPVEEPPKRRRERVRVERTELLKMVATQMRHSFACFVFYLANLILGIVLAVFELTKDPRFIYVEFTQVLCFGFEVLTGILMMQSRYFTHWWNRVDLFILFCSIGLLVVDFARDSTQNKFEFEGFVNVDDFLLLFRYIVQVVRLFAFTRDAFMLQNCSRRNQMDDDDSILFTDDEDSNEDSSYHHKIRANSYPPAVGSDAQEDFSRTFRLGVSPNRAKHGFSRIPTEAKDSPLLDEADKGKV
jgi:hypothetical protein